MAFMNSIQEFWKLLLEILKTNSNLLFLITGLKPVKGVMKTNRTRCA